MPNLHRATLLTLLLLSPTSITSATPLTPRHSYALICALSSSMTRQCSSSPLFYFCTAAGALAQNFPAGGPYVVNDTCEGKVLPSVKPHRCVEVLRPTPADSAPEYCECIDTRPAPPKWPPSCIINIDGSAICSGKQVVGVISNVTTNETASLGSVSTSSESVATLVLPTASSRTALSG